MDCVDSRKGGKLTSVTMHKEQEQAVTQGQNMGFEPKRKPEEETPT